MSIELEYAMEHKNDPAVLCCRLEGGSELTHHNLEDPAIFPDLIDSGLLDTTGCVTIGQAIGATLKETSDSLTPLTPALLDNIQEVADEVEEEEVSDDEADVVSVPAGAQAEVAGEVIKLYIEEGKNIAIEFPV